MDALRISPRYTSLDWERLNANDPEDWAKATKVVRDRLDGRFLRFAGKCLNDRDSGFVVLAIDSLLAETIQQFIEGITNGHGQSKQMFMRFLEGRQVTLLQKVVHGVGYIVDVERFHAGLKGSLDDYLLKCFLNPPTRSFDRTSGRK